MKLLFKQSSPVLRYVIIPRTKYLPHKIELYNEYLNFYSLLVT